MINGNLSEYMVRFNNPLTNKDEEFYKSIKTIDELSRWACFRQDMPVVPEYNQLYRRLERARGQKTANKESSTRNQSVKENKGTVVKGKKISRNSPCPCGSGRKYKHCCGK